jgi:phage-related baseplate assembly protein
MNHSIIDLSKLPAPEFVEKLNYEVILDSMLTDLKARCPSYTNLLESDPAYKILEVAAYRELLIRHRMNEEGRALLVAFAIGSDLDHIGITYYAGEARLVVAPADPTTQPPTLAVMEDDESYRRRLLLKDDSYSTAGAANAYKFHALSADGNVKDASVTSPRPGTTVVTILSRIGDGTVREELLDKVRPKLNSDEVRPLSEELIVQAAEIIWWELEADIYTYNGPDQQLVLKAAEDSLVTYLSGQQMLQGDITDSALSRALHVPGVFKVVRHAPLTDIVCNAHQAAWCTKVTLRIAGTR